MSREKIRKISALNLLKKGYLTSNYTKYDGSVIEVDAQTESVYLLWVKIVQEFAFLFGLMVGISVEETSLALM